VASIINALGESSPPHEVDAALDNPAAAKKGQAWLACLVLGYIGVYLCRKNLSVAIPILQEEFNATRSDLGKIASYSTIAYAIGKFCFGPLVDRIGGRVGFLASLLLVAIFGVVGSLAPTLGVLGLCYSLNRFAGSAAWPGMVKMAPEWFPSRRLPFALAVLSLSFVFGGVCATLFAGQIAEWSHNNWRAIMGFPSLVLILVLILAWVMLPRNAGAPVAARGKGSGFDWRRLKSLAMNGQFWIVCSLSFTLTLMRETFNTWTVDFIKTDGGAEMTNKIAAFLSTPFDAMGALGILSLGWVYGRISGSQRKWILIAILLTLGGLIFFLPSLLKVNTVLAISALGLIGFLTYGPYSLLAGIFSVEIQGKESAGSVSGFVDGFGYLAGILAGQQFGRIVDHGGYMLGFQSLAGLAAVSAILCLGLYRNKKPVQT